MRRGLSNVSHNESGRHRRYGHSGACGGLPGYHRYARTRARIRRYTVDVPQAPLRHLERLKDGADAPTHYPFFVPDCPAF